MKEECPAETHSISMKRADSHNLTPRRMEMDGRKLRDLCCYMSACQVEPQNSSADTTQGGVESLREHVPPPPLLVSDSCLHAFGGWEDDPAEGYIRK